MSELPDDREACHCIPESSRGPRATCWYCIHGQHEKCTANKHGNPDAYCPKAT